MGRRTLHGALPYRIEGSQELRELSEKPSQKMRSNTAEACQYANWQEEMLLRKKLNIIKSNEKTRLREIYSAQRVVQRRFQTKLWNSRMLQARMYGDHELVTELRTAKQLNYESIPKITSPRTAGKRPMTVPTYAYGINERELDDTERRRTVSTAATFPTYTPQQTSLTSKPSIRPATAAISSHANREGSAKQTKHSDETANPESKKPSDALEEDKSEFDIHQLPRKKNLQRSKSLAAIAMFKEHNPYSERLNTFYKTLDPYKADKVT